MTRLIPIDPRLATGEIGTLLATVQLKRGFTPTLMRLLAHAPVALESYLDFADTLAKGLLSTPLREQIAIAVAAVNNCRSCMLGHMQFGREAGLPDAELRSAQHAASVDVSHAAALRFACALLETRGQVSDMELAAVRDAGFSDARIIEIAAAVALNFYANVVNNLAQSLPDFPDIRETRPVSSDHG